MPKPTSIFISYAHRDGSNLARRLEGDLKSLGFDVWLDKPGLKGGDRWTQKIEEALDHAQVVLALLSEGSFASDICRAEQNWALKAGKHVIPVKVESNCRAPLPLADLHHIDFSDLTNYAESLQELQKSLGGHRKTVPPPQSRYNNAPSLPDNFVGRRAVSASWDKTLKVWDLNTGLLIATFHCDAATHCCACADNQRIVAGDTGGRVYILSLEESRR